MSDESWRYRDFNEQLRARGGDEVSAECEECGTDLAYDGTCVRCVDRARIAVLEDENKRLKYCGNCGRNSDMGSVGGLVWRCSTDEEADGRPSHPYDYCHFTPSSWHPREGEGGGMAEGITFWTEGLNSKFGFSDGDILDDLLYENVIEYRTDTEYHLDNHHEILARVIERFILPAITAPKDIEVHRTDTCHNPLRTHREEYILPSTVEVPVKDILAVAAEVEKERGRD